MLKRTSSRRHRAVPAPHGRRATIYSRAVVRQRIFGLACAYADGNDAARLADMPCTSSCSAAIRSPDRPWPRSPHSRFENAPGVIALTRLGPKGKTRKTREAHALLAEAYAWFTEEFDSFQRARGSRRGRAP